MMENGHCLIDRAGQPGQSLPRRRTPGSAGPAAAQPGRADPGPRRGLRDGQPAPAIPAAHIQAQRPRSAQSTAPSARAWSWSSPPGPAASVEPGPDRQSAASTAPRAAAPRRRPARASLCYAPAHPGTLQYPQPLRLGRDPRQLDHPRDQRPAAMPATEAPPWRIGPAADRVGLPQPLLHQEVIKQPGGCGGTAATSTSGASCPHWRPRWPARQSLPDGGTVEGMGESGTGDVVVLGAGVIGLTTAVTVAEGGHRVLVRTAEPPGATTSAAAGALWGPWLAEPRDRVLSWASYTLDVLTGLAAQHGTGVRMTAGKDISARHHQPGPAGSACSRTLGPAGPASCQPATRTESATPRRW
jgi:hypothetical protein